MHLISKIFRAGNDDRITRIHSLRGDLIPKREIFSLPIEFLLRLLGVKRRGPWLCKSAVEALAILLEDDKHTRVLEIGGGKSTTFFSKRTRFLMTIEEDPQWANKIKKNINKDNSEFQLVIANLEEWLDSRTKNNMKFDIVLIDGGSDTARRKALEILPSLNSKAVYILDNSDRAIFNKIEFQIQPKRYERYTGMIRHPFQATETTFYFFE